MTAIIILIMETPQRISVYFSKSKKHTHEHSCGPSLIVLADLLLAVVVLSEIGHLLSFSVFVTRMFSDLSSCDYLFLICLPCKGLVEA